MLRTILKYTCLVFLFASVSWGAVPPRNASRKVVVMAADNWCPYTCDIKLVSNPGYLVDIAKTVFEAEGYGVEFRLLPYTRAIKEARDGVVAGILGAARGDVPDFVFPTEKFGYIINTFFVRKQNPWHYTDINSLKKVKIGIVDGYDYASEEFSDYVTKNKDNDKVEIAVGDEPLLTNLRKVQLGRIDAAIDDVSAATYIINQLNWSNYFKQAGILGKPMPIYIAFSPKDKDSEKYAAMMTEGVVKLRQSGELKKILAKYGMVDWELMVKQ
jgi:polar amino acid transport system substrate-binding protein